MTDKEAMNVALEALEETEKVMTQYMDNGYVAVRLGFVRNAIAALKERLADPMREVQRLGQEIECPECKAEVLYECVACSSNNYPPHRTEQEPVELPCCGYTDASAVKWNPFNGVVQCHNCGQCYTTPPQRTWVGLTLEQYIAINCSCTTVDQAVGSTERQLKENNT